MFYTVFCYYLYSRFEIAIVGKRLTTKKVCDYYSNCRIYLIKKTGNKKLILS